jgi:arylsulfatase A-like enzyme
MQATRNVPLASVLCLVMVVGLLACHRAPRGRAVPSAIIFISIDSLRADYLNSYGYERFETSPVLDAFAKDAILFENCIVAEPWTLTSHMSLMTGVYPQRHDVRDTSAVLAQGVPTLAGRLADEGFVTKAFVDGVFMSDRFGFDHGFDDYSVVMHRGLGFIVPKALTWVRERRDERFFLFLHTYDVHSRGMHPYYDSPPPYRGMFSGSSSSYLRPLAQKEFGEALMARTTELSDIDKDLIRARYAEAVRFVDDQLGRLFEELDKLGVYDDALVIVSSDHGDGLFDHSAWGHIEVYDHTIRVPLLVKLPRGEHGGTRVSAVVEWIDLMPTILALAGGIAPEGLDGESILGVLEGEPTDGVAYSIWSPRSRNVELFSIRTQHHHYVLDRKAGENYFFDLEVDPLERDNLSPSDQPEEATLRDRLARWMVEHDRETSSNKSAGSKVLDESTREQLRALGYAD